MPIEARVSRASRTLASSMTTRRSVARGAGESEQAECTPALVDAVDDADGEGAAGDRQAGRGDDVGEALVPRCALAVLDESVARGLSAAGTVRRSCSGARVRVWCEPSRALLVRRRWPPRLAPPDGSAVGRPFGRSRASSCSHRRRRRSWVGQLGGLGIGRASTEDWGRAQRGALDCR